MSVWTYAKDLFRNTRAQSISVTPDWIPLSDDTDGFDALTKPLRAIRANTAGTVTVVMASGESRTLNFAAGDTRYGIFVAVTGATATGLEGAL
jgi:hypothetical protein